MELLELCTPTLTYTIISSTRLKTLKPFHTGRRFQSESTLQDIEIGSFDPDLDV